MNMRVLSTALLVVLCGPVLAKEGVSPTVVAPLTTTQEAEKPLTTETAPQGAETPKAAETTTQEVQEPIAPTESSAPKAKTTEAGVETAEAPPEPPKPIDPATVSCDYKIPAETTEIRDELVKIWAQKAVAQSFDFQYKTVDNQVEKLEPCYTKQGWKGFQDALKQSGNLKAIKKEKLTVTSQLNGDIVIKDAKDNHWKVIIPLDVVYKNKKEKLSQKLTVNLSIGRKITGDLGIMQMIAVPKKQEPAAKDPAAKEPVAAD